VLGSQCSCLSGFSCFSKLIWHLKWFVILVLNNPHLKSSMLHCVYQFCCEFYFFKITLYCPLIMFDTHLWKWLRMFMLLWLFLAWTSCYCLCVKPAKVLQGQFFVVVFLLVALSWADNIRITVISDQTWQKQCLNLCLLFSTLLVSVGEWGVYLMYALCLSLFFHMYKNLTWEESTQCLNSMLPFFTSGKKNLNYPKCHSHCIKCECFCVESVNLY